MFTDLSQKFEQIFKKLRGYGKLSEQNISEAMREVRLALLEADVNFKVVKDFVARVKEKAVGQDVLKSISPGQQVVKIVHDEMVSLLGSGEEELHLAGTPPARIMLVGLQGSGKTTTAAKLANLLRGRGRTPLLIAADIHRPAAIKQLQVLGNSLKIPVYAEEEVKDASAIAARGLKEAQAKGLDLCIIDTAGRQHVDDEMMEEALAVKRAVDPSEVLFVADAMTGQDAVNAAKAFYDKLDFTGVVLTKIDGDARGGAALSIHTVTQRPIKLIGTSEKLSGLEPFHPDRMASRILGMGDIVSLVEKAQEVSNKEEAEKLEKKIRQNQLTLEDFLAQLQQLKKMGPMQDILEMIPGMNKMKGMDVDENAITRTEAIVNSMTVRERRKPTIIDGSRRKRIAKGSGTQVGDVNRLLKQFDQMQKMLKQANKSAGRGSKLFGGLPF